MDAKEFPPYGTVVEFRFGGESYRGMVIASSEGQTFLRSDEGTVIGIDYGRGLLLFGLTPGPGGSTYHQQGQTATLLNSISYKVVE